MESILDIIHAARQSQLWPLYQAVLVSVLFAMPLAIGVTVTHEEAKARVYAALQLAFRRAGVSNTAAAINAHIGESLASKKIRGEKPATLDFLAMSPEVFPWLGLELIQAFGMPDVAVTATRVSAAMAVKES